MIPNHPNATRSGWGTVGGTLISWLLNKYAHTHLSVVDAGLIAGGLGTVLVYLGRDGIVGAWKRLLHGSAATPAPPPAA